MRMSAEEVKDFWRGYCRRRKIAVELIARGEKRIEQDPDYWADRTMDELLALVGDAAHKPPGAEQ